MAALPDVTRGRRCLSATFPGPQAKDGEHTEDSKMIIRKRSTFVLLLLAFAGIAFIHAPRVLAAADGVEKIMPSDALFDVAMVGSRVWAVGYRGRIFASTDAGATWSYQASGTDEPLFSVSFIDADTGWAVGEFGTVLKTEDGGRNWRRLKPTTENTLRCVHFVDATHGWIVGAWSTILSTKDGGVTWQDISYQEDGQAYDAILEGVCFVDRYTGWAVGEFSTILRTSDGGVTWEKQPSGLDRDYYLTKVFSKSGDDGWVVGQDGQLRYTRDGGATWVALQNPSNDLLLDIAIHDDIGFAVGKRGTAVTSTDGGLTWRKATLAEKPVNWWLGSIAFDGAHGVIVGGSGTIIRTEDAGTSWQVKSAVIDR